MVLFSIVAVPISCYLVLCITGERGVSCGAPVRGVIWFVPVLALVITFRTTYFLEYSPRGIFWFFALRDGYLYHGAAVVGFLLFYHRVARSDDRAMVYLYTLFLAAFFTASGIAEIVLDPDRFDAYRLIVLPAQRAVLMALLPILVGAFFRESRIVLRLIYFLFFVGLPALFALSPMLFTLQYRGAGIVLGMVLAVAAAAGYLVLRLAYYPDRGFTDISISEDPDSVESTGASIVHRRYS